MDQHDYNLRSEPAGAMGWLDVARPPCRLTCAYCGTTGDFAHARSFRHHGETLSLHSCTECSSLIYDLRDIEAPIVSDTDDITPEAANAARYVLESGFSSYYVALCGLSSTGNLTPAELRDCVFVDVGAGMGMASLFMKSVVGVDTVTVEPSYTGKLAQEILGRHVHRAYFEELPTDVLQALADKPCLLHLNSVVEHLVDPFAVLASMIARARIEVLAIVVPDGGWIDFEGPFVVALPYLAPRDHRHLPTQAGATRLLERLGFQYTSVQRSPGLVIATGARKPVTPPSELEIKFAETLLLERMLRHPHPQVAAGGAARLLPNAATQRDEPLMAVLRRTFPYGSNPRHWLALIHQGDWTIIPHHLGPSCYWLAYDAFMAGYSDSALALLDITEAFADAVAGAYPEQAMTPLNFKWAGLLLRAQILAQARDVVAAAAALLKVKVSIRDRQNGASHDYIERADAQLDQLRHAA